MLAAVFACLAFVYWLMTKAHRTIRKEESKENGLLRSALSARQMEVAKLKLMVGRLQTENLWIKTELARRSNRPKAVIQTEQFSKSELSFILKHVHPDVNPNTPPDLARKLVAMRSN